MADLDPPRGMDPGARSQKSSDCRSFKEVPQVEPLNSDGVSFGPREEMSVDDLLRNWF